MPCTQEHHAEDHMPHCRITMIRTMDRLNKSTTLRTTHRVHGSNMDIGVYMRVPHCEQVWMAIAVFLCSSFGKCSGVSWYDLYTASPLSPLYTKQLYSCKEKLLAMPTTLEPRAGEVCRPEEALATFPSMFYGEHILAGNAFHQERGALSQ